MGNQLDGSIYFKQETPDIMGSVQKGLSMRAMMDQQKFTQQQNQFAMNQMNKEQAADDAYKAGIVTNPDGTTGFDQNKTLSAMANVGGKQYLDASQAFRAQDAAMREQKIKQLTTIGQLLGSAKDQTSWENSLKTAQSLGLDISKEPKAYDPGYVNSKLAMTMAAKDQSEAQHQKAMETIERQKLGLEGQKVGISARGETNKERELKINMMKEFGGTPPPEVVKGVFGNSSSLPTAPRSAPTPDTDPAEIVRNRVPSHLQQKAFDEIEAAQNTAKNAAKIMAAFDSAAKNVHAVDFIPGMQNVDQKTLHALMGPTFKDVEGTVRQAAMDNMNDNTTPQFGDNAATVAKKRDALKSYLQSKSSAPINKGAGIDLTKFNSTTFKDGNDNHDQAVQWAQANPKDPRSKEILKINQTRAGN